MDGFGDMNGNEEYDGSFGAGANGESNDDPFALPDMSSHDAPQDQYPDALGSLPSSEASGFALVDDKVEEPVEDDLPLKKWEADHAKVLQEKLQQERESSAAIKTKASTDVSTFYNARTENINKSKVTNRADEKHWKADMEATMDKGTQWEKVTKLCDLKPKVDSKANQPAKNDRMRRLLAELKMQKE